MQLTKSEALAAPPAVHAPLPDGWRWVRLGDVGDIVSGITLGRKLGPAATRRVPYLRVANVKDGFLDLSDVYEIEATRAEIDKCRLQWGDLLLTEGGDPDKLYRMRMNTAAIQPPARTGPEPKDR